MYIAEIYFFILSVYTNWFSSWSLYIKPRQDEGKAFSGGSGAPGAGSLSRNFNEVIIPRIPHHSVHIYIEYIICDIYYILCMYYV